MAAITKGAPFAERSQAVSQLPVGPRVRLGIVAVGLLALLGATPVLAACNDELATLDERVNAEATKAIAASSSGQGVAAKRDGQAAEARDSGVAVADLPKAKTSGVAETQATSQAAQAGGAGDRVMQAKATINTARVAKGKGDEAGCLAGAAKAKAQLDR